MFSQEFIQTVVDGLVMFATDLLLPFMCLMFVFGVIMRGLIFYTIKREDWFAREFEKRVMGHLDSGEGTSKDKSFYVTAKRLLEKTYYELFEIRAIMKRRNPDFVESMADRIFLIQHGVAWLVKDTLKQIKYLKHGGQPPKLLEIAKTVFQNNPCFNKVFGIVPSSSFNSIIGTFPGMFIIGGIFGTFLGIMRALPELGGMDLNDVEGTKMIMDQFLLKISFSMTTSIIGIVLSVCMTIVNTVFSPEKLFVVIIDRFENCTDMLWNRSENNILPDDMPEFDEHLDPLEALATESIQKELLKNKEYRQAERESEMSKAASGDDDVDIDSVKFPDDVDRRAS